MSDAQVQELLDRFAITELRARFFRTVDEKDWEGFRAVFTEDCTFDLGDGNLIEGADAYVAEVKRMLTGAVSVHRGTLPELVIDGPTEAHGVWALNDYIEWTPDPETGERRGYMGFGREYDEYRKVDGEWKIATWRLKFDRMDPLPRQPLPDTFLGGAEELHDEGYVAAVTGKG